MIHLRALLERAGGALVLADPDGPAARAPLPALSGVHMSELPDPTPYLDGGELLLTTGMPFTTAAASDAYFARLAGHGVVAVGFGVLGEGDRDRPGERGRSVSAPLGTAAGAASPTPRTDSTGVPGHVAAAAARHGVLLLVVPEGRRFSEVSQAYWALVNESETASLVTSLGSQRALVRAALGSSRPPAGRDSGRASAGAGAGRPAPASAASAPASRPDDARAVILRTLAEAVGGWTAYLPADGAPPAIAPARMAPVLRALGAAVDRVNANGVVGAATFRLSGDQVTEHPVLVRGRLAGFLALGAGRRPTRATRELVLAAVDALATAERIREAEEHVLRADAEAVAALLARGHADAALSLAADRGVPVPARVRVLVVVREGAGAAGEPAAHGHGAPSRRPTGAGAAAGGRAAPDDRRAEAGSAHGLVAELLRAVPLRGLSGERLVRCHPSALVAPLGADAAVWFVPVGPPPSPLDGERSVDGASRALPPALAPVDLSASQPAPGDEAAESGDDGEPRYDAPGAGERAIGGSAGAARPPRGARAGAQTPASGSSPAWAPGSARGERPIAARVRAAASGPLDRHEAAGAIARTAEAARRAAPGRVAPASAPRHDVDGWMRVLDAPEHAELRETVLSFLGAHTSWERASRALGVHRNTVRQRIARAEALLGVDLQDADVTSRLWLALRAG